MATICLITDSYPPEIRSASIAIQELAEDLRNLGHSVTVITTRPRYNLPCELQPAQEHDVHASKPNERVLRVRSVFLHNVGPVRKAIGQILLIGPIAAAGVLKKRQFDAVIIYSPPLPLALAALAVARVHRARLLLNVQDLFPQNAIDLGMLKNPFLIRALQGLEAFIYRRSDRITVHSEGHIAWLEDLGYQNVTVVPNWFDFSPIPRDDTRAVLRDLSIASKFTVLFGGVLGYAQDLDVILDAAEALRANPDVQFLVLGDGPERSRLQAAIAERRLVNLHLRSLLEASSYRRVLGAVDIGLVTLKCAMKTPVVPSKTFGFFAAGLPVITAVNEESDLRRIIEVSSGGINVPAGDGKALAQAIELLWRNKPLAREYGNNGRRYGKKHFGVRQASLKYLTLLGGSAHYLARTTKGGMSS